MTWAGSRPTPARRIKRNVRQSEGFQGPVIGIAALARSQIRDCKRGAASVSGRARRTGSVGPAGGDRKDEERGDRGIGHRDPALDFLVCEHAPRNLLGSSRHKSSPDAALAVRASQFTTGACDKSAHALGPTNPAAPSRPHFRQSSRRRSSWSRTWNLYTPGCSSSGSNSAPGR
jgi:hypothetical protein